MTGQILLEILSFFFISFLLIVYTIILIKNDKERRGDFRHLLTKAILITIIFTHLLFTEVLVNINSNICIFICIPILICFGFLILDYSKLGKYLYNNKKQ